MQLVLFFVVPVLGVRYEMYSSTNWNHARDSCVSHGGKLAKVRDEESNLELVELIESRGEVLEGVWLGAQDRHKEGDWIWISDHTRVAEEPYTAWCEGSPTNINELTDCMVLIAEESCWTDMLCALPFPYACEFDDTIEPVDNKIEVTVPNSRCREETFGTSGERCFDLEENEHDCLANCQNNYELSLAAVALVASEGRCCCYSRCSCLEIEGEDIVPERELSVLTQTPQCSDQDITTVCTRLGYSPTFTAEADRLVFKDLSCGSALQTGATVLDDADAEESIVFACCCTDEREACCPDRSAEECLGDVVLTPEVPEGVSYHAYTGVSCLQETGFDDGIQCFALDYDASSDDPTHACWEHCLSEYSLPLSASWGRRSTSECCCVTKCACFDRDDDDVHLAIIDSAPGPSNDASEVKACETTTSDTLTIYETTEAASCRVDSALLDVDEECYRRDFSLTERGRQDPAADCWLFCESVYNLPLAAAYGDSDQSQCCCATACLCLEQPPDVGQHAFLSIIGSKDGPFNDANELITCAALAASVSPSTANGNDDGLGAAAVIVLSIGLVTASFSLAIAILYKRNLQARRLFRRFVPTATAVELNDDDPSRLVYANDVELMPAGDVRDRAVI